MNLAEENKHISTEELIDYYMETVVNLEEEPFTVEELGATYDFTPAEFYSHFEGFDQLNKVIFRILIDNAIEVLEKTWTTKGLPKKTSC